MSAIDWDMYEPDETLLSLDVSSLARPEDDDENFDRWLASLSSNVAEHLTVLPNDVAVLLDSVSN